MGHTRPDWTSFGKLENILAVFDLGELAARLVPVNIFHRGGNVLAWDSFDSTIDGWDSSVQGAGSSVALSTASCRTEPRSVLMTTGPADGRLALFYHGYPYPKISRNGFEISFALGISPPDFEIQFDLYTGSILYSALVKWDKITWELSYKDSDGNQVVIDPQVKFYFYNKLFNTIKLVVDFFAGEYVKVILNEKTHDLSGIPLQQSGTGTAPSMWCYIRSRSRAAIACEVSVDDFILTQNEP